MRNPASQYHQSGSACVTDGVRDNRKWCRHLCRRRRITCLPLIIRHKSSVSQRLAIWCDRQEIWYSGGLQFRGSVLVESLRTYSWGMYWQCDWKVNTAINWSARVSACQGQFQAVVSRARATLPLRPSFHCRSLSIPRQRLSMGTGWIGSYLRLLRRQLVQSINMNRA